ncbi:MAG TPA: outer membrane lipoprotein chaperone LolA [Gemmatimonadaceae bacterium]|nr:outer membrane lipoprotein chaperone LolA [Gemmatimonadaceae bacterium]
MRAPLVAVFAICLSAFPLAAQSPEAVVHRAVVTYAHIKTERASFTQVIQSPVLDTTAHARGEIQTRPPGRIDIRFTQPDGDRIVSDGRVVWLYLPSTNPGQVIKTNAGASAAGIPDVTAQFLDSATTRYSISDGGVAVIAGHATHAAVLVPKRPMPFSKATVWVDDRGGLVRQVKTVEASGVVRTVTLFSITTNGPLDADAFTFKVPKGVHVYDQTHTGI